jgi:hypothetical protein
MKRKSLINQLELAYAPMTAYEFAIMKDDLSVERSLEEASLYAIGQRAVMTFENVIPDEYSYSLKFEIHQKGNKNILKGKLPLIQKAVGSADNDVIYLAFNFLDKKNKQKHPPLNNIHGFSLLQIVKDVKKFLIWFSPEKLLQNWWKGNIVCEIEGDFRSFTNY